jgi:HK97 family phage major capsid protein
LAYNNVIDRTGGAALIPEGVSREIIQGAAEESAVLRLGRRLPNMSSGVTRMPVLSALPMAYFVTGDTGLKQTTEVSWDNKYLNAEEIAAIVPIPEAVLDDAGYPIWDEVRPRLVEAIGGVIDAAVLFGTNAPSNWPDDILTAATAAGNVVDLSTHIAAATGNDLYSALLGDGGVVSEVEEDGFMVTGHVMPLSMRGKLRGLRDDTGQPIFMRSLTGGQNLQSATRYELDGEPIIFPRNGSMNAASVLDFAGDWNQLVYSIRQDLTWKLLTEAVIQDGSGAIVYNLAQQDMVALRVVMRLAWQVPNPINLEQEVEANRYPFGLLVP